MSNEKMNEIKELWVSEKEHDWEIGLERYYVSMKNKSKLL